MENLSFVKMHGLGNDFIIIDDRKENFPDQDHDLIQKYCDRHFGIGADGFILMRTSVRSNFKMLYFNSDGHPSSLCGNGSRCLYAFAQKYGVVGSEGTFETSDVIHKASIKDDQLREIAIAGEEFANKFDVNKKFVDDELTQGNNARQIDVLERMKQIVEDAQSHGFYSKHTN